MGREPWADEMPGYQERIDYDRAGLNEEMNRRGVNQAGIELAWELAGARGEPADIAIAAAFGRLDSKRPR